MNHLIVGETVKARVAVNHFPFVEVVTGTVTSTSADQKYGFIATDSGVYWIGVSQIVLPSNYRLILGNTCIRESSEISPLIEYARERFGKDIWEQAVNCFGCVIRTWTPKDKMRLEIV